MNHRNRIALRAAVFGLLALLLAAPPLSANAGGGAFVVNTADDVDDGTCDSQHCSLREALNAAIAQPGSQLVWFNIPGPGPHIIAVSSPLPAITDPDTVIDGTTQPGYSGAPLIALDGGQLNPLSSQGLVLQSNNNTVRGLSIIGFGGASSAPGDCLDATLSSSGMRVASGTGNLIEENYIGLTPAGAEAGNTVGVLVQTAGQTLRNNVISGNGYGILATAPTQTIQGNMVGTDPSGSGARMNRFGISLCEGSDGSLVGGASPGQGNVISANATIGVLVRSDNNVVQGNRIGTNAAGTAAVSAENEVGIALYGSSNLVGGTLPGEGNLIAGVRTGIYIGGSSQEIYGNRIGSDISGTQVLGNGFGIESLAPSVMIGGDGPGQGNLIVGSSGSGIHLDLGSEDVYVAHNTIAQNNTSGDANAGGIRYFPFAPGLMSQRISRNSIFDNGGLGLSPQGPDAIPAPQILGVSSTQVSGTACAGCEVELFEADPDPSGAGEGKTFLAAATADNNGEFTIDAPGINVCTRLTATAIDANFRTSAFSQNYVAGPCLKLGIGWIWIPIFFFLLPGPLLGALIGRRRGGRPLRFALGGAVGGGLVGVGLSALLIALPWVQLTPPGGGEQPVPYSLPLTTPAGSPPQQGATRPSATPIPTEPPTATFTAEPSATPTSTSTATQPAEALSPPTFSADALYYRLASCGPKEIDIGITANDPQVYSVVLFYRLKMADGSAQSDWNSVAMNPQGGGAFSRTLRSEADFPGFAVYTDAQLQVQFVATDQGGNEVARTEVFSDVAFKLCTAAGG